jgi:hypothetical protein
MRLRAFVFLMSILGASIILSAGPARTAQSYNYALEFSTYFGAKADCRGMTVDEQGNVYITGATWQGDWPTTEGAYDRTWHGEADVVISKWSPEGKLIWSTMFGSKGHDRAYSVKVDKAGYVYLSGRASPGFPTTPESFQPKFNGVPDTVGGEYGAQNGFVTKMTPDGSKIVWSSFVGTGQEVRDMALDDRGDIYMTMSYDANSKATNPPSWFAHAISKSPHGEEDCGVIKVSNDGKKVYWATWIGGSQGNAQDNSLCVGPDHCPILFMGTHDGNRHGAGSTDQPTTPGVFKRTPDSSWLGKISADGSHLIFATFIGDGLIEGRTAVPRTHDVALDPQGNVFVGLSVTDHWPVTSGAFQTKYGGGKTDFGIAKFSPTGKLLAGTYLGGSGDEVNGPDTISVDKRGNVLLTGGYLISSLDYPVTSGCFQPKHGGGPTDGVLSMLSNDLSTLLYSTYMGGSSSDALRANAFGPDDSIYVAGNTSSPDWPTKNAYQSGLKGEKANSIVLAKFTRVRSATSDRGGR